MSKKWADKISPPPAEMPDDITRALNQINLSIRDKRMKLSVELEEPINSLICAAARPGLSKDQRSEIVSSVSYLLNGIGLAIGYPFLQHNKKAELGAPCSLVLKSSRLTSHWLVLRTRSQDGVFYDSPALTPKPDRPTPALKLVECITSATTLNRERATRSLRDF